MSLLDPPDEPGGNGRARHRARHAQSAAPETDPAPDEFGYPYGDGHSAVPLYGSSPDRPYDGYPIAEPTIGHPTVDGYPPAGEEPIGENSTGYPSTGDDTGYPSGDDTGYPSDDTTGYPTGDDTGYPSGDDTTGYPTGDDPTTGYPPAGAEPVDPTAGFPQVPAPAADELVLDLDGGRTARTRADRRAESGAAKKSRAGRNLPAAIGVGVTLGGVVLASLFVWRPAFLFVVGIAACVGVWEMVRAIAGSAKEGPRAPMVPLLLGCPVMIALAWYGGSEALILGLALTVVAAFLWRLADGPIGYQRDAIAAALVAVYVPFLAGFAVMLVRPSDGDLRVVVTLAAVVLSDTGGYVAGVFFGKNPMAPTVSPKKSWEGLGGSLVATAAGSAVLFILVFHEVWWHGVVFGLAVSAAAVLGDLAESLLKRDLGVKDMSSLLPGHGGLMDRLDSILLAAPTAYAMLTLFAPVHG